MDEGWGATMACRCDDASWWEDRRGRDPLPPALAHRRFPGLCPNAALDGSGRPSSAAGSRSLSGHRPVYLLRCASQDRRKTIGDAAITALRAPQRPGASVLGSPVLIGVDRPSPPHVADVV